MRGGYVVKYLGNGYGGYDFTQIHKHINNTVSWVEGLRGDGK